MMQENDLTHYQDRFNNPLSPQVMRDGQYAHLSPYELIEQGIKTERVLDIPLELIVLDINIVDEGHVDALKSSIEGPRGLLTNPLVRARKNPTGEIVFDVIDGFHRVNALQKLGKKNAECKVVFGCDDEEMYDLRVLAAVNVKSVQFARIAHWMQNSFAQTEWAKKGVSLVQICRLYLEKEKGTGTRLGLSEEDVTQAKIWIGEKAARWNKPVSTIYNTMEAMAAAAPDLLDRVRTRGGGPRSAKNEISPARLIAIAIEIPGEYALQRRIVDTVLKYNLIAKDAVILTKEIAANIENPALIDFLLAHPIEFFDQYRKREREKIEAERIAQDTTLRTIELNYAATRKEEQASKPEPDSILLDISETNRLAQFYENIVAELKSVRQDNQTLEKYRHSNPLWWKTIEEKLTEQEKIIIEYLVISGKSLKQTAELIGILEQTAINRFLSAINKHREYLIEHGFLSPDQE